MTTEIALGEIQQITAILTDNNLQVPAWDAPQLRNYLDAQAATAAPDAFLIIRYVPEVGVCLLFNADESDLLGAASYNSGMYYAMCRGARCIERNANGYEGCWLPLSALPTPAEQEHLDWTMRVLQWMEEHTVTPATSKQRRKRG